MLIDPLTTFAQIVNFLILVALLKQFLYAPITQVMKKRERHIAQQLQEAAAQQDIAQQEAERYRQMQQDFESQRSLLLSQAQRDADEHRQMLLQQVREQVDDIHATWTAAVEREKEVFLRTLRQQVGQQLVKTVRWILQDLANTNLEQQIIEVFLDRLNHLPSHEKETLEAALSNIDGQEQMIYSTFAINDADQARILEVLHRQVPSIGEPIERSRFATVPGLICGIELKIPGYKLAWNLEHYLEMLEVNLTRIWEGMTETLVEKG